MSVIIKYAGLCLQGLVRINNEDNLWYPGGSLPMLHGDLPCFSGSIVSGPAAAFAIFDGMGGEDMGEAASYLAADEFGRWACRASGLVQGEEGAVCRAMNRAVLSYAEKKRTLGTTVVSLCFGKKEIFGFNLGDSRCYRLSEGELYALSTDHAMVSPITRRSRLTQCLGIPETDFILEPAVYAADYSEGDIFLLCSDGLTSMVNPVRIQSELAGSGDPKEKIEALREMVFSRGAEDNVTMLLFEVGRAAEAE